MPYTPEGTGFRDMDTSRAAATTTDARHWRDRVLEVLEKGPMTADEVSRKLGASVLTVRPRFTELRKARKIMDTGERRRTASGKTAAVFQINPQNVMPSDV